MVQHVVAISVDKVQSFLYYVLEAYIQEDQANSGTLKEIIGSSNLISTQFSQDIGIQGENGEFNGSIDEELLNCSGMCIFTTSLDKKDIEDKLGRLFRKYYTQFRGQLLLKYVYFEREGLDKLEAIKKSKVRLRQQECLGQMIAEHRDLLFQFCDVQKQPQPIDQVTQYPSFAENINALYSQDESDNDNHFRIAIIKADLDGMGNLFDQLESYEVYSKISGLLSKYIRMDYLHSKTKEYQEKDETFKLYPLYMAGDDIFFAVTVAHLLDGINLCKEILQQLNQEIGELSKRFDTDLPQLSMSVGIDFTFNREPIRYYYERVQRQVECAKSFVPRNSKVSRKNTSYMKISINDYVFLDYDGKSKWYHFKKNVELLKGAMQRGFAVKHFLYGLLNKLNEEVTNSSGEVKLSNAVLYHLLPKHLVASNDKNQQELRAFELLIIDRLLWRLLVEKSPKKTVQRNEEKNIERILSFEASRCKDLERYVRSLLLFIDPRFEITGKKVDLSHIEFEPKKIKSTVFNKTLRYLYAKNLNSNLKRNKQSYDVDQFRKIFVRFTKYTADNGSKVQIYRTLNISHSMFYRFKELDKEPISVVGDLLQSVNDHSWEEIKRIEEEREREKKAPPGLYFDRDKFCRIGNKIKLWTNDYIDSLLVFYRLKELSIQFKKIYPNNNSKQPNKHHKKRNGSKGVRK